MPTTTSTPDVLTRHEVAQYCNVHPDTVTDWAKAGKLASFRTLGGHRRYYRTTVEAFQAARTAGSRS